ncbi:ABC transporter permease [Salinarimonas ramus]|uniref:ABC di/oligopeptide transporter inner membrane subunit n=1 Tax=Salinarimonas ramus TaxID=690164 RepID=A0A917QFY3_9HYPH|nr:ABC transporter permease [Salinarimonas ramus]GGK48709.1 ABC di/oligopeptide transporter inner membrane subunit [Salinarimonas ramus]
MRRRFILSRLSDLVVVLFGVSVVTFLMIRLVPGDAVAIMLGANAEVTPERMDELRARIGLDQPILLQYLDWIGGVLTGNLGESLWTRRPVIDEIAAHVWPTIQLAVLSLVIGATLAVPLGVLMARLRGRGWEIGLQIGSVAGLTVPSFWLGIMMILALATLAPSVQMLGYVPFTQDPLGNLARLVLPAIALALPILANLARLVRSAMLDALQQDYIRTARAKGVSERAILYKHALRNALIPFVTSVGIMTGYLLSGAIVVEQVFAIPGLGRLLLGAIAERNYPLLQATILLVTVVFVAVNFVVDLVYAWIDPRVTR